MGCWIFKQSDQVRYPDKTGLTYVYDNRHSVRVAADDSFIYLDKRSGGYGFSGHGVVKRILTSPPTSTEFLSPRVSVIYTAEVTDYVQYVRNLDIRAASVEGKRNRSVLGIRDVNRMGWSRSIAQVSEDLYTQIVELAYRRNCIATTRVHSTEYKVPDAWSFVRRRHNLERFRATVLRRQSYTCAICGTTLKEVLDVAHISKYATDLNNRANPANGIGLCAFCHRAFDGGVFQLSDAGILTIADDIEADFVTTAHMSSLSVATRLQLLEGVDRNLLRKRFGKTSSIWT